MKHSNYQNLLKMIITRNKGFWRIEALGRLSKKISQGHSQLEYLKNLITLHKKQNQIHYFLQINSIKSSNKKFNSIVKARSKSSQTFFVTQIPSYNRRRKNKYNKQLFMNEYEENIYSPIELHPFEIKYMRQRDENQKYYNVQKIKKEIEKNYDYIRKKHIKNRPFSSYYQKKMNNKDLFGNGNKFNNSNNISINYYYSNNLNMSKKRKKRYKINFNINYKNNHINNTINQKWNNSQQKKRLISEYLSNRAKGNILAEENELFENIKKNKTIFNNSTVKTKVMKKFSSIIENFNLSKRDLSNKLFSLNDINKSEINKRIFSSINNEKRKNLKNNYYESKYRNNKSARLNKILNQEKILFNQNNFNSINNLKENNNNSILFKNEYDGTYIDKKSKIIKIK